ncbi:hypothetical protein [Vibrio navarrensis]|uniref:hypothetical protein n=1 Tax=Vibrio navarrensis TaxID=29495 RepID=UPI0018DCC296|nr:hypothetical protein [Vibrio navarrensis]MBH9740189.1 hypothetical protein [Vibrio navarrensis]
MLKNFALMTLAAFALTGCNSSSSKSSVKPEARFDYPIIDARFSPNSAAVFHYSQMVNGVTQDDLPVRFEKHSGDSLLQLVLDQDEDNSPLSNLLNSLINYGWNDFFLAKEHNQEEAEPSIFVVGSDGYLREITDFYVVLHSENPTLARAFLRNYAKIFQVNGDKVPTNPHVNPNLETKGLPIEVPSVKSLLNNFEDDPWLQALSDQASCKLWWAAPLIERGSKEQRKTFTIDKKRIEATYISNKHTYQLNCDGQASPMYERGSEIWYNPTFGILEQSERLSVNQQNPVTTTIWLDSLPL